MTEILIEKFGQTLHVRAENHCKNRDVCIAVSAIINTLVQYSRTFRDEHGGIKLYESSYDSGKVELMARGTLTAFNRYMAGIKAIAIGLELYAENYPDDVRVHFR